MIFAWRTVPLFTVLALGVSYTHAASSSAVICSSKPGARAVSPADTSSGIVRAQKTIAENSNAHHGNPYQAAAK